MTKEYTQMELPDPPERVEPSQESELADYEIEATHIIPEGKTIVPLVRNPEGNAWQARQSFYATLVRKEGGKGIFISCVDTSLFRDGRIVHFPAGVVEFEIRLSEVAQLKEKKKFKLKPME